VFAGFIIPGSDGSAMDFKYGLLLVACVAAVIVAGCTDTSTAPVTPSHTPAPVASTAIPAQSPAGVTADACSDDVCTFIPPALSKEKETSLRIEASPRRYSPIMSSTPGVGLAPNVTGFNASSAVFTWNASYGQFLFWDAPDYTVNQLGATASNSGGKLYWSFIDRPASTAEPVVITVIAKDPASGTVLGRSNVTLAWDGNYTVTVQDTR